MNVFPIRCRIEILLPYSPKAWAALAQTLRSQVNAQLSSAQVRRLFWGRFADTTFGSNEIPEEEVGRALLPDAERLAEARVKGRVTISDAGSGDGDLLTHEAIRALWAAEAIRYGELVSNEVRKLARREAKRRLISGRSANRMRRCPSWQDPASVWSGCDEPIVWASRR